MKPWFSLILGCSGIFGAERWEVQYFYDENRSSLVINDIQFASEKRGLAIGGILKQSGDLDPVALITINGGDSWVRVKLPDPGVSLCYLDEAHVWMIGGSGIWFSDEGGRSWRRLTKEKGLSQIEFVTAERGWAVGAPKKVIETSDGGKTWTKLSAIEAVDTNPERTVFHAIDFASPDVGMIVGRSHTARERPPLPIWMDPTPEKRPEWPAVSVFLETRDGGKSWKNSKQSIFGTITRLRLSSSGPGLALLEFQDFFTYPAEIHRLDMKTGKSQIALRRKDLAATDVALSDDGTSALASGFEPPGRLARSPIPGRVRILKSDNLTDWHDMAVDYRAVATRVHLATYGKDHAWAATDTGMILCRRRH